jgi:predicted RNA-binding protein with PIN domain
MPPAPADAGPKRSAAALPPAVFDDSVEAAEHLVRLNGVVLLVDGYNVSKLRWPELSITEQRQRLVSALGRLAARTGADIHVVFDGADQAEPALPPGPRRLVRISFSPPGVEADDVVLELIAGIPAHRPVVVASSDRRVQDGAVLRGANVISSPQLVAVLAR